MPDFEHFKYRKQFFVIDVIVELGRGKSPRMKSDWVNFAISWRNGGKDSSKGVVRSIRFDNQQ